MIEMNRQCSSCEQPEIWKYIEESLLSQLVDIDKRADRIAETMSDVPYIEALPMTPDQQAKWDQERAYRIESSTSVSATVALFLSGVEAALDSAEQIDCATLRSQSDNCPRLDSFLPRLKAAAQEFDSAREELARQGLPF
ncbi:MAG TPA: hypothetical protein VLG25_02200 [Patescibacteria group bacterium]|nr:hypothetical protein [Patescibacteria group bacterium]